MNLCQIRLITKNEKVDGIRAFENAYRFAEEFAKINRGVDKSEPFDHEIEGDKLITTFSLLFNKNYVSTDIPFGDYLYEVRELENLIRKYPEFIGEIIYLEKKTYTTYYTSFKYGNLYEQEKGVILEYDFIEGEYPEEVLYGLKTGQFIILDKRVREMWEIRLKKLISEDSSLPETFIFNLPSWLAVENLDLANNHMIDFLYKF